MSEAARKRGAALLAQLQAGDAAAFRELYEQQRARLYTFLLRLTRDEQLARDLAQETWLRLAANAARLEPGTQPGAWLFTVARNLFVSSRRFRLFDGERLRAFALLEPPRLPEPLEAAAGNELERRLARALSSLPLAQREVLLLVSGEGFSLAEVATMLDVSEVSVRKRLSRGRAALRDLLRQQESP